MIGVVVVTHGKLAHEFRAALEHVVGPQDQFETISIGPDDDLDVRRSDMLSALARVDSGKGVLAVTTANGDEVPVDVALETAYGSKTVADLAPGKRSSQAFTTRQASVPAGAVSAEVTGIVDGETVTSEVSATYDALTC